MVFSQGLTVPMLDANIVEKGGLLGMEHGPWFREKGGVKMSKFSMEKRGDMSTWHQVWVPSFIWNLWWCIPWTHYAAHPDSELLLSCKLCSMHEGERHPLRLREKHLRPGDRYFLEEKRPATCSRQMKGTVLWILRAIPNYFIFCSQNLDR